MGKLSINIKIIHLTLGLFLSVWSLNSSATKMAPITLDEALQGASVVAEVKIVSSEVSDVSFRLVHTGEDKPFIQHGAVIVNGFKGLKAGGIVFLSRMGLLVNSHYLVFLDQKGEEATLRVAQAGYAAIFLDYISLQDAFVMGGRVPVTYLRLPEGMEQVPGVTRKDENSEFRWVHVDNLFKELKK